MIHAGQPTRPRYPAPVDSEDRQRSPHRYALQPDPVWDGSQERDGVLLVELSWTPDALAGRPPDLVVSPALAAALTAHELTGFRTGAAQAAYDEDAFDVEPGTPPPPLVRLILGDDETRDLAYARPRGLTASNRALDVLQAHCDHLQAERISP